jgi:hypothetical protein
VTTGDYLQGSFSISITRSAINPATGKLEMDYAVSLEEPKLKLKLNTGTVIPGVFITCLDVYYSELLPLEDMDGTLEFGPGKLKGKVSIRPFLWAGENIKNYSNKNLHEDYGNELWDFYTGSILAIGNEFETYIGPEKLAPMESIFSIAKSDEVTEGEIKLDTGRENITILCNQKTFEVLNILRGTNDGKATLLSSIYLPAVMEVLSQLRDDHAPFEDKKWYRVFMSKCNYHKIDHTGSILEDAQKLLQLPVKRLLELEGMQ